MDNVAELYTGIKNEIERGLSSDSKIQTVVRKMEKGTATHVDTEKYAKRLGELTSKAFKSNLTAEKLPNGNLSYSVAKGTVGKTMRDNLTRVNAVGKEIQTSMNTEAGIGLKAMGAKLNADRVDDLVSNMDNCHELEDARKLMEEPVINTTQSYADDLIKENADAQYETGFNPKVIRTAQAGCCEWCAALEGVYDYPVSDEDVYKRHEHCNCIVTYHPTKNTFRSLDTHREYRDARSVQARQAEIEARRNYGL